ncbi:MAG TPA: PEGA domain-containing protein [Kofleriaceae bacterium]|nr:PEGA domain-containing protein [Kofleriaceae bacterium]
MSSKPEPKKTKGMCIATRCTSVEQFIQMFHRFVDEESFFVSTLNTRAPGLETSFSVQLQDGTPVLRGLCVVMQAWTDGNNPFKTPGVRLGIKRLTANSMVVFEQLLITRSAAKPPPVPAAVVTPMKPVVTKPLAGTVPKATATPPKGTPLKPVSIAIGVPKAILKSPLTETAPAKSAPSRVEVSTPARAASEPIPEPINPEPTDVIEEKTDVREPKKPVAELEAADIKPIDIKPVDIKPIAAKPSEIAFKPIVDKSTDEKPAKPAEPIDPHVQETKVDPHVQETKVDPFAGERAPGSDLVLPANPLMNLSDESLEGYVDCTLYEETGNFFPVDGSDEAGFVDEVVPPPVLAPKPAISRTLTPIPYALHEPRLPTVTPLPPTPTVAAALDAADAERGDAARSSQGSQSLVVPPPMPSPPMPRESVMVDPELIARGSTPAVDHGSFDSPTLTREPTGRSNFDADDLPLPAKPRPAKSKRGSWWLLGGALGVLVGAVALVLVTMSSSNGGAAPKTPPKPAAKEVAQVTPPVDPNKPQETGDSADTDDDGPPPDEPPPGSGPPMVGSGPCKVVVASTPAGSMVALDDKTVGPSPLTVGTSCEKHKLDISHARYQSTTKFVTLAEGKDQEVEVTLSRPTHVVTVSSNPSGAQIFIDGRSAGTTPSKLSVLGFTTLKLEFKKTGYQPASAKLYSKVAQDKVAVKLNKW